MFWESKLGISSQQLSTLLLVLADMDYSSDLSLQAWRALAAACRQNNTAIQMLFLRNSNEIKKKKNIAELKDHWVGGGINTYTQS